MPLLLNVQTLIVESVVVMAKDTYCLKIWLSGEQYAWLQARYPKDEPDVAIAKLVGKMMNGHIKAPTIEPPPPPAPVPDNQPDLSYGLERIEQQLEQLQPQQVDLSQVTDAIAALQTQLEAATAAPEPEPEPEPVAQPEAVARSEDPLPDQVKPKMPPDDPISRLQELTQSSNVALPNYTYYSAGKGFRCICQAFDICVEAVGRNKKIAKAWSAAHALQELGNIPKKQKPKPKLKSAPRSLDTSRVGATQRIIDLCDATLRAVLTECSLTIEGDVLIVDTNNASNRKRLEKRKVAIAGRAAKVCGRDMKVQIRFRPVRLVV